jgi:carbonic anhydrase/acetyltransferase-like protein (isoleucine patch superfamily)
MKRLHLVSLRVPRLLRKKLENVLLIVVAKSHSCPGCTIGQVCVIAAMAVVTKSCEPNGLYAGFPAIRIKNL